MNQVSICGQQPAVSLARQKRGVAVCHLRLRRDLPYNHSTFGLQAVHDALAVLHFNASCTASAALQNQSTSTG